MHKAILISILAVLSSGCDRIKYEAKNSEAGKSVSTIYTNATRLPLGGQIDLCEQKEKERKGFYDCMTGSGYKMNPEYFEYWKKLLLDNMAHSDGEMTADDFKSQLDAILEEGMHTGDDVKKRHGGPPYWLTTN